MPNLKQLFKQLPKGKRILWVVLATIAFIMLAFLDVWLLTVHGVLGLMVWTESYRTYLLIVIGLTILFPILYILDLWIASRRATVKRIPSRAMWGIIIGSILVPSILLGYMGTQPFIRSGDKQPQLIMLDGTGANDIPDLAVTIWTQKASSLTLNWGTNPSDLNFEYIESRSTRAHALVMNDLLPATQYFYSFDDGVTIYNFTTSSGTLNTFHFAFTSDGHYGREETNDSAHVSILEQIVDPAHNFEALFLGGDLVEDGWIDEEWGLMLTGLSPYTTQMPFRNVIGNHDGLFGGVHMYRDYFYPASAPLDTGSQLWQHIQVNGIHLFFLDLEWGIEAYTPAQKQWFESELALLNPDEWILVFSHSFTYASGIHIDGMDWFDRPEMIEALVPLFEENGVDLVFNGHNHHLEALNKSGVYYNIVGGFGCVPDPIREHTSPYSSWYQQGQNGFVDVSIAGDSATVVFRSPEYVPLHTYVVNR